MQLNHFSPIDLLNLHDQILNELQNRKIVRTKNNPLGDYTEWLVADKLGLILQGPSNSGYDAIDKANRKYQIKGRRITTKNKSRQLSAIRNLNSISFDYLIAVIYDYKYNIIEAYKIPHMIIHKYSTYRNHVNAHILILDKITSDPLTQDIKSIVQ